MRGRWLSAGGADRDTSDADAAVRDGCPTGAWAGAAAGTRADGTCGGCDVCSMGTADRADRGASMTARHRGHGPATPAMEDGTVSRTPQCGQPNVKTSGVIMNVLSIPLQEHVASVNVQEDCGTRVSGCGRRSVFHRVFARGIAEMGQLLRQEFLEACFVNGLHICFLR